MPSVPLLPFERYCRPHIYRDENGMNKLGPLLHEEIQVWAVENIKGEMRLRHDFSRKVAKCRIEFSDESDAILFKLRWL